jgi:hypothetical protein
MLVSDLRGRWYKVEEDVLTGNEVDREKVLEVIAAERAEKRKKIVDYLSTLDQGDMNTLKGVLLRQQPAARASQRSGISAQHRRQRPRSTRRTPRVRGAR